MKPVVLQLIDSFNQGGSERQALQLTRLLSASNRFEVRLACLDPEGSLRQSISDLNLGDIPSFPLTSFYDSNALVQLRRFVKWSKAAKVDVLHTHDFYTNVFGMAGGTLARIPVRIASMRETAGMRTGTQRQAQRLAYSLSHNIVANSAAVKEKLLASGIHGDKVSVIYNGLDLKRLETPHSESESLELLGLGNLAIDSLFVTIVANMRHDVKDYPMFLKAAQKVKQAIPSAKFLLAGESELTGELRPLAEDLQINTSTHLLGRCDHISDLLNVSRVCVLSSKAEGFSNSIIEYMAAGRPVVATRVGGAGEAVVDGETGYLVSSGDDQSMAERIIDLLKDLARARSMGHGGREIVKQRFSCETQLQQTENLYEKLLNSRAVQRS